MAATRSPRLPKLRRHKTGQGFVEIGGKRHYLGRIDLPETQAKYHRLIAEMSVNGGHFPIASGDVAVTIVEMVARFWAYHKNRATGESNMCVTAAIEAGLTDHVWEIEEIVAMLD